MMLKVLMSCILMLLLSNIMQAQQITGNWKGKIGNIMGVKHELKLVQRGDSIYGVSYYYMSKNSFYKYSVKGYFNPKTNAVVWWDDKLIETKNAKFKGFFNKSGITEADFNCPGGGVMMLDGKTRDIEDDVSKGKKIHLDKTADAVFDDEWNVIIDNWTTGGNNWALIDSVKNIAFKRPEYEKSIPIQQTEISKIYKTETIDNTVVTTVDLPVKQIKDEPKSIAITEPKSIAIIEPKKEPIEFLDLSKPNIKTTANESLEKTEKPTIDTFLSPTSIESNNNPITVVKQVEKPKPIVFENIEKPINVIIEKPEIKTSIEEKFLQRSKIVLAEIPIADSIELYFYDNAEVDGDSISLFLDDVLFIEHIRLSEKPYIVTLHKEQLSKANSITMVAENLGAIPPNTSYVKTYINGKKYDATLSSTEQTSAVIKFKKE